MSNAERLGRLQKRLAAIEAENSDLTSQLAAARAEIDCLKSANEILAERCACTTKAVCGFHYKERDHAEARGYARGLAEGEAKVRDEWAKYERLNQPDPEGIP